MPHNVLREGDRLLAAALLGHPARGFGMTSRELGLNDFDIIDQSRSGAGG